MTLASAPPCAPSRRWWVLALVAVAQLMVVLDLTIVNIALPSAQKALHFSNADRQWIVTAYALAFGSLLPLGGRLGDIVGRKRAFITGLVGFAVVSAIGGAAQSFMWLISARAVQGVFAALLAPAGLALLTTTFTVPEERGKAFGVYGAIVGSGAAVGLLLGGILTEYLNWRWCLYVNVAFAVPTALVARSLLVNRRAPRALRIDWAGAVTAGLGLFALVFGFDQAERHGWTAATTLACLAAGVLLLVLFVVLETRERQPLLPMRVLADRNRGGSYLAVFVVGIGLFGVFLFLTYYFQQTLHYSPVRNGLAFLPMVGAVMLTSTSSNALLLQRVGPRPLVVVGMVLAAGGMVLLTGLGLTSSYATDILPSLLLIGAGLGLVVAPSINTATAGVKPADSGIASALVNVGQQVGGSIGTSLLNTLAISATTTYLATHHTGPAPIAQATIHGYSVALWTSAGVFAVGAVVCGLLLRGGVPRPVSSAESAPSREGGKSTEQTPARA